MRYDYNICIIETLRYIHITIEIPYVGVAGNYMYNCTVMYHQLNMYSKFGSGQSL